MIRLRPGRGPNFTHRTIGSVKVCTTPTMLKHLLAHGLPYRMETVVVATTVYDMADCYLYRIKKDHHCITQSGSVPDGKQGRAEERKQSRAAQLHTN